MLPELGLLSLLIALVPESVSRSMSTSEALIRNGLKWAACRMDSRSTGVVMRIGSTDLMRNGSMSNARASHGVYWTSQ